MIKIKLFCAAAFSTNDLAKKMKKAADERGLEVDIEACAQGKLADVVDDLDVALLGPQIGYTLKKCEAICEPKGVPVAVIPMADYGMMNGEKVLDFALDLIEKNKK